MAEPNRSTSVLKSEIKLKSWARPFSPHPNALNVIVFFLFSLCPMLHPPTNFAVYLLIIFCAPPLTDRQTNITWEITSSAEVKKNMKTTRGKQESSSNLLVRSFSCLGVVESPRAAVLDGDWKRYSVPLGVGSDIVQQSLCLKHTEALSDNSSCVQRINSWQNLCFVFFFFVFFTAITLTQWGKTPVLLTTLMIAHSI